MLHNIIKSYKAEREEKKRKILEERKYYEAEEKNKKKLEKEKRVNDENGQIELISEINEGKKICVEHGGSAVAAIFLNEYGLSVAIPENDKEENHYSNQELAITFALLNAGEIVTVEQDFSIFRATKWEGS